MLANIFSSCSSTPNASNQEDKLDFEPFNSLCSPSSTGWTPEHYILFCLMSRSYSDLEKHRVTKLVYRKYLPVFNAAKPGHEDILAFIVDDEGRKFCFKSERRCPHMVKPHDNRSEALKIAADILTWNWGDRFVSRMPEWYWDEDGRGDDLRYDGLIKAQSNLPPRHGLPPTTNIVVRQVFEPVPNSLSLLQLSVILHSAIAYRPDHPVEQKQWCYYFTAMAMGLAMLWGGRVRTYTEKWSKKDPLLDWKVLKPHAIELLDEESKVPEDLSEMPLPEPPVNEPRLPQADFQRAADSQPTIKILKEDIWTTARTAQRRYYFLGRAVMARRFFTSMHQVEAAMLEEAAEQVKIGRPKF